MARLVLPSKGPALCKTNILGLVSSSPVIVFSCFLSLLNFLVYLFCGLACFLAETRITGFPTLVDS